MGEVNNKAAIAAGETSLGIEFGSTNIKAVLMNRNFEPIASGSHGWENRLEGQIWTYHMSDIIEGMQDCYRKLKEDVKDRYDVTLTTTGAIGISAMMHGYMALDRDWNQIAEFRTWRNTITGEAAEKLTEEFQFNIPQRWSIAHLYQAMLNQEASLQNLSHLTTLAGYIHHALTNENVVGIGEASGMFPIDSTVKCYKDSYVEKFDALSKKAGFDFHLLDLLPSVALAGDNAGCLTSDGARLLDPAGDLLAGIPLCPPEGDAGTGMVATNSVRVRTGNVSAGTSDFAMIVVDHELSLHREIDMVTTPDGLPVAMVHCNNCTSDINAWVNLFAEFSELSGGETDKAKLFPMLFKSAMEADPDCGGLLSYNYFSGEGVTDIDAGRPMFLRKPDAKFTLANFMRCHIMSAMATLKIGLDILSKEEQVSIDTMYGHGGFFKTPLVGQSILAAAANAPISCMETAGEGGPYGMALLASFMIWKDDEEALPDYLSNKVFAAAKSTTVEPDIEAVRGFDTFMESYKPTLEAERQAVIHF